ncbi:hypothetical protein AVEN_54820-1 [Araneus ventricosus]|uniref:RNase H type-1 domain-containing protein n=1 Tax=Araneus ventricosus TaxID=182803 RepID=A0A4Y2EWT1_ARAVE|nr:hypothetical protein AVEN_54820-1 [Araneus ventricosus]
MQADGQINFTLTSFVRNLGNIYNFSAKHIYQISNFGDLWILTDSRSSIQHLKNWTHVGDKTSLSILQKLKLISLQHDVHFQWISSHVDIHGNELADNLAKEGSSHPIPSSLEITSLELFSREKAQNEAEWLVPPSHHWYKGRKPGLSPSLPCDRQSQYLSFTTCQRPLEMPYVF